MLRFVEREMRRKVCTEIHFWVRMQKSSGRMRKRGGRRGRGNKCSFGLFEGVLKSDIKSMRERRGEVVVVIDVKGEGAEGGRK